MDSKKLATLPALVLASAGAAAGEWDTTGFVGVDSRAFREDGSFATQSDDLESSLQLQAEAYWRSDDGRYRFSAVGFGRYDGEDDERSHVDLREAYWGYDGDGWDVSIGLRKIFWGVAESRHLVDVINQTDLVEDIDQEDKLGQPMINVNLRRGYGRFELYVMPRFRERTFPGSEGRLRAGLMVDSDSPIYASPDGERHADFALRWSHYIGDVDIGAYVFDGTSREPSFVLAEEGDRLLPFYSQIKQVGVDAQLTRDSWLWKFEGLRRETREETFSAAVAGLEYTFYGIGMGGADLGVLFEYLYDGRGVDAPLTLFDDDVFVGARFAFNDASDTSVLAGAVVDSNTHEIFFNLEAERRFGDNVTVDLGLRAFSRAQPGDALSAFEDDDYLQLSVSWFF
ncbi:MAG TPA: hypothetical protein VIV14_01945 [Gammaproteobacteria bacterium]